MHVVNLVEKESYICHVENSDDMPSNAAKIKGKYPIPRSTVVAGSRTNKFVEPVVARSRANLPVLSRED